MMKGKDSSMERLMNQYDQAIDALREGNEDRLDLCIKAILINRK